MLVDWSVGWSLLAFTLAFLGVFCITAPTLMLELAFFITAPAHLHATSVAVYPALFTYRPVGWLGVGVVGLQKLDRMLLYRALP